MAGGENRDVNTITSGSLARIADHVKYEVLPTLDAHIDERMEERPSSSANLEKMVEEKLRDNDLFVTHDEMELAFRKKCEQCQSHDGALGKFATSLSGALSKVQTAVERISAQVSEWKGAKQNNGLWLKTIQTFVALFFAAILGLIATRMNDMHREQMVKQAEMSRLLSAAMAQLQAKAQP
jgi:hypothetical protein